MSMISIQEIQNSLLNGKKDYVELMNKLISNIALNEPMIHAFINKKIDNLEEFISTFPDHLSSEELQRKPLLGVPVVIKDNINVKSLPTTAASKILKNYISPYDATVVKRIQQAGGIIIGKANMDEFAMGSSTETSAFYPTLNPINHEYAPGGSSGGSAACVRMGFSPVSLGTDTGGSIRQPASFCGVVGIRPTYGFVSRFGMISFCSTLDQIGPIASNVEDAFTMLQVISGHDSSDSTSSLEEWDTIPCERKINSFATATCIEKLDMDPTVKKTYEKVIRILEEKYTKTDFNLKTLDCSMAAYHIIADSEASSNLARFDGIKYGLQINGKTSNESFTKTRSEGFGMEVKRRILLGTFILSKEFEGNYYKQALYAKEIIAKELEAIFTKCQFLVLPTSLHLPFKFGEKKDPLEMYYSDYLTIPAAIAGMPAISIPTGTTNDGFSVGMQIMGPRFSEKTLRKVAIDLQEELKCDNPL